jgi:glutathione S-transferase
MAFPEPPVIGYHRIRGLGAPLRMICCFKGQPYVNAIYGADMKESWFAGKKEELKPLNSCINIPYVKSGDEVVTQSNTCLLYLGRKLGIDTDEAFIKNHTVLDEVMDLRNKLMTIVYPFFYVVKSKEEFPEGAKKHLAETVVTSYTKLEGFCEGPYMCGAAMQSGDFHLFEMLDQHSSISAHVGEEDPLDKFPKLKALHTAVRADPALKSYFESDQYVKFAQNNGLYTNFTGFGDDFVYGGSEEVLFTP